MAPDLLVERHYAAVYNLAYRTLGRREDAEDIAQQTFVRALPRLGELRDPAAAGGWLCRIAANLCTDELRQRGRGQALALAEDGDVEDPWASVADPALAGAPAVAAERAELRLAVWRAALSLPPQQRLALALRELHGMTYAEIAAALRTSVEAVEALLFRARQGFRRAYEGAEASPVSSSQEAACDWALRRLSASIDDEIAPGERARLEAHVADCGTCRFAARELRATSRIYALVPLLSPPSHAQAAVLAVVSGGTGAGGVLLGGLATSAGAAKLGLFVAAGVVTFAAGAVWSGAALDRTTVPTSPNVAHVLPTQLPVLAMAVLTPTAAHTPAPSEPRPTGVAVPAASPIATATIVPTAAATANPTASPSTTTPMAPPLPTSTLPIPRTVAETAPGAEASGDPPTDGAAGDWLADAPTSGAAWPDGEPTPVPPTTLTTAQPPTATPGTPVPTQAPPLATTPAAAPTSAPTSPPLATTPAAAPTSAPTSPPFAATPPPAPPPTTAPAPGGSQVTAR